jgi:hypothetical protein
VLSNSFGSFDGSGFSLANFTLPAGYPAALIGLTASHAYLVLDPITFALTGASNAANCLLTPGPTPPTLVINEIDYDQPGGVDSLEFIEILNVSSQDVLLANLEVQLLDGSTGGAIYGTGSLSSAGILAPGGYLVLATPTVAVHPQAKVILMGPSDILQDGPMDVIRIVDTTTSAVIDAVGYAGTLPGFGEGTADTLFDIDSIQEASLSRCPNGTDTDDNDADFGLYKITTPGADNVCG